MSGSLSKFGVPYEGHGNDLGMLQPKLSYRYRVTVYNFGPVVGGLQLTQQVQSVAKPSIRYTEVPVHSYNSTAYVLGKHEWSTTELVVKDDVTNLVSNLITFQMQKQLNQWEQTAFGAAVNFKFTMNVETLDGGNDSVLDTWQCLGCMLTDVKFATLDYARSDLQLITMTVRFDNALMFNTSFDSTSTFPPLVGSTPPVAKVN